MGIKLLKF